MRISDWSSDVCSSDLVRRREIGRLREFRIEPVDERLAIAVEHPEREPQRPHILAAQRLLVTESEGFHRVHRQLADVELQKLPFGETTVVEREIGRASCRERVCQYV